MKWEEKKSIYNRDYMYIVNIKDFWYKEKYYEKDVH